jgi:tRNA-binding protein
MEQINYSDFEKVHIRTGKMINAEDFPNARVPAYKLTIDFGEHGIKKSSAQITQKYSKEELIGKQVLAVTNFFPKQIANFKSEVLVLGIKTPSGVTLLNVDEKVELGSRVC